MTKNNPFKFKESEAMNICAINNHDVSGEFLTMAGERYYAIRNVNAMPPFFVSLISDSDHWLFVSSTGGLTAGRVSPETALFPYVPVDRVNESNTHTGCKTIVKVNRQGQHHVWEPFNTEHAHLYQIKQNLYKNTLGDKICFEETNVDLQLVFRYTWMTSDEFGFCRQCELHNLGDDVVSINMVDGLQNILPAGTPRFTQSVSSNLVDAYKWSELDEDTGLAMYALYSGITDRAEPCESLRANTVFSTGFEQRNILLCNEQLAHFRQNKPVTQETHKRGIRGAYFLNVEFELLGQGTKSWQIIANIEQRQSDVSALIQRLSSANSVLQDIIGSVEHGSDALAKLMAAGDGFQITNEENVSVHHYANTLFNNLRGGVFDNQYLISTADFLATLKIFNAPVFKKHCTALAGLPEYLHLDDMSSIISSRKDSQLERLSAEYLPITFGRRHGDPSRPWNQFSINVKDDAGKRVLSYEGNWRDIFQNWEALSFSYPFFVESIIAKFVNASTIDGYNPYRITKGGIDWEVEEPDDPWSYIGYWGDHQIIYLLKMLELSQQFHPQKLSNMLKQPIFSYANVPYRLKSFEDTIANAKDTVLYDEQCAQKIEQQVHDLGADGKLILDEKGQVYQVNLLEKLLVPLLSKLGNLVVDGGIWLNTQRPEWNDANNALVGQGVSMVTLNYLRRYVAFLQGLLAHQQGETEVSYEVVCWLQDSLDVFRKLAPMLNGNPVSAQLRFEILKDLGVAACRYRTSIYKEECFSHKVNIDLKVVQQLLEESLHAIDHTIEVNIAADDLCHAYNLLRLTPESAEIEHLYPMLEGQVAALSTGSVEPAQAVSILKALFASDVYREDQKSFMLYPDRAQQGFLSKNVIPPESFKVIPVLNDMIKRKDERIVLQDANDKYRFSSGMISGAVLNSHLTQLKSDYPALTASAFTAIETLYEQVFNHQAFTGRSGGMFGFEGLGSVYWHMVSKLLLAVKENFYAAVDNGADSDIIQQLGAYYYKVREGIGFNKTPQEYGAFPYDPYSHTPKHAGAQQPGMTGQVKEEILSRFGELGIHVDNGEVRFNPRLLRSQEFLTCENQLRYLDVDNHWQQITVPKDGLAFTWCQIPIVYVLFEGTPTLSVKLASGESLERTELVLDKVHSQALFGRTGHIRAIHIALNLSQLFAE